MRSRPWYRGFAVTSPFKRQVADTTVNTLRRTTTGWEATNTDLAGARAVLARFPATIVLGHGGATDALTAVASLTVVRHADAAHAFHGRLIWTWPAHISPPAGLQLTDCEVGVIAYGAAARTVAARIRACGGHPRFFGWALVSRTGTCTRHLLEDHFMNTFGELFRLTTFGESHGPAMGAVIDGCPAGVPLAVEQLQAALDRRRPGQSAVTTSRKEADAVELLSGVYQGKTLGTPIAAMVRNTDARSADYANLADRPGHADRVWRERFHHLDPRGGGRTSGRETLCRVIGGAIAEAMLLRERPEIQTVAWVSQVGPLFAPAAASGLTRAMVDAQPTRMADAAIAEQAQALIVRAKETGDSYGGSIDVRVVGLPVGLGEPVFGKLKARLSDAYAGIGAVTGVVWGDPAALARPGSQFHRSTAEVYGGIQGGLSNGEPLALRIYFKPPATLGDTARSGRHDPCILPRAVPVIEAMTALVLADAWLLSLARPHRG